MGGIGKTQIALEFCRLAHMTKQRETVFWINAQSEGTVVSSFVRISTLLSQSDQSPSSHEDRIESVLMSLNTWPHPYLLVYDNYDDPNFHSVLKYAPSSGPGALLFTSRLRATGFLLGHSIDVEGMMDDEAIELLKFRSGLNCSSDAVEDGMRIVQLLDGLPLAIDHAGAYMRGSGGNISFRNFPDQYEKMKKKILGQVPTSWQYKLPAEKTDERRSLSALTTWELSLELLGSNSTDKAYKEHFLTLAAFLGGHRVSMALFRGLAEFEMEGEQPLPEYFNWIKIFKDDSKFNECLFRDCIIELNDLSLVRGFTETDIGGLHFAIHPLTRDWARLRLPLSIRKSFTEECLALMTTFFEKYEDKEVFSFEKGSSCALSMAIGGGTLSTDSITLGHIVSEIMLEIEAHVRACIHHCQENGLKIFGPVVLIRGFATILEEAGHLDQAILLYEESLQGSRESNGIHSNVNFELLNEICSLRYRNGLWAENIEPTEALVHIVEEAKGADDPHTLFIQHNLADVYHHQGDTERARTMVVKLKDRLSHINMTHGDASLALALVTVQSLVPYGLLKDADGLLDAAKAAMSSLSWVMRQHLRMYLLAFCILRLAQNRPVDAEMFCNEYISKEKCRLGEHHPEVIFAKGDLLAECFIKQGRWSDAATEKEMLYAYLNEATGPCHKLTQDCAKSLAVCWIRASPNEIDRPNELLNHLIQEQIKVHGTLHRKTLEAQMQVAHVYFDTSNYRHALTLYKIAYKMHEPLLKPEEELMLSLGESYAMCVTKLQERSESDINIICDMFSYRLPLFEDQTGSECPLAMRTRMHFAKF